MAERPTSRTTVAARMHFLRRYLGDANMGPCPQGRIAENPEGDSTGTAHAHPKNGNDSLRGRHMANTFVRRLVGAAMLNAGTYEEVEADRSAMPQALGVVVLASLAAGIGAKGLSGGAATL